MQIDLKESLNLQNQRKVNIGTDYLVILSLFLNMFEIIYTALFVFVVAEKRKGPSVLDMLKNKKKK